jgi:phosphopantothenoylcysteine decarboxylase/phosphopantothenate--cysteine ligase
MGYAIAKMAMLRGADVTLISGPTSLPAPAFVDFVSVVSAQDMFEAVAERFADTDFVFKAAAVADYTPDTYCDDKIKKKDGDLSIPLKRTQDILRHLGQNKKDGQVVCGFSMETQNMLENSRAKLQSKNVDMICANNLKVDGAGFGVDTNIITLITQDDCTELPLMSKEQAAIAILDKAITLVR